MAHEFDCGKGGDWLIDFYFPPTYTIQTINKQKLLLLLDKYVINFQNLYAVFTKIMTTYILFFRIRHPFSWKSQSQFELSSYFSTIKLVYYNNTQHPQESWNDKSSVEPGGKSPWL